MTPAKELPIVIEKSQEEIEQSIALVRSSNLPEGTKTFVIGCINLAFVSLRSYKHFTRNTVCLS